MMHDLYKGGNVLFYELGEKIAKLMEEYGLVIEDIGRINDLIEGTIEDNRKASSVK